MEKKDILEFQSEHYYIMVDKEQNLILIRPVGFWGSDSDVSDYLPTIQKALDDELQDGFDVICDLAQMKSASKEMRDGVHAQASLEVLKRKVGTTVMVSPESAITRMQIEAMRKAFIGKSIMQVPTVEAAYEFIRNRAKP